MLEQSKKLLVLFLVFVFAFRVCAQKPRSFPRSIPKGDYSGITSLGGNRYAVVDDKSEEHGFYIWTVELDTIRCVVSKAANEGFVSVGEKNRDAEAVAYLPSFGTLLISSERDNTVEEYCLNGNKTGRILSLPDLSGRANPNLGIESLTCGHGRVYAATERPLTGDSLIEIYVFDDSLRYHGRCLYRPDGQKLKNGYWGVSELCATHDGRLLVLEREIRVRKFGLGSRTTIKIYETRPCTLVGSSKEDAVLQKSLLLSFKTGFGLFRRNFGNYEGMCEPYAGWLLLVADSQHGYKGVLHDWMVLLRGR